MKQSLKEVLQNSCSWGPVAKFKEKTDAATRGVLYKKVFLKILQNSQENTCTSLFFHKVAGLRPTTLSKKRLWHGCFTVNFVKFLRTPFLHRTPLVALGRGLFLKNFWMAVSATFEKDLSWNLP